MTMFFKPSHVGEVAGRQLLLAGKVLRTGSQGSNPGSRAC